MGRSEEGNVDKDRVEATLVVLRSKYKWYRGEAVETMSPSNISEHYKYIEELIFKE